MRTKPWKNGMSRCKSYIRTVGNGYEVGFTRGNQLLFVGNFIHSSEATRWYTTMNRQIAAFGRRFKVAERYPTNFMWRLLSNYLYQNYYAYLDTCFARYNRTFRRAVTRDVRQYKYSVRSFRGTVKVPFLRAA